MCGRFSLGATVRVGQVFDVPGWPDLAPRYNIAPGQDIAAVIQNRETARREVRSQRWGLVPSWAKDGSIGNRLINARAETVAAKPAFRTPFRERRCLVPADGFYEWERQGRRRQPWHIRLRDARPFAFAGLWDRWQPAEGAPVETVTIVTTEPNALVGRIHDRMPVILPSAEYGLWLDPAVKDVERLHALLRPYPEDEMLAYPVSALVNNPASDSPDMIVPLTPDRTLPFSRESGGAH
jgi:putative SOS response-associated peptidase YedK